MLRQGIALLSPHGRKLFEVARTQPNYGYGQRYTRKTWIRNGHGNDSFWTLTRIVARKQGTRLKAYGRFTWRGITEEKEREIRGAHKREWTLFSPATAGTILANELARSAQVDQTTQAAAGGQVQVPNPKDA
jgi:hypothetical protein